MRCVVCDAYTTGGEVSNTCDTCLEIIRETLYPQNDKEPSVRYTVEPAPCDVFGRVVRGKYEE